MMEFPTGKQILLFWGQLMHGHRVLIPSAVTVATLFVLATAMWASAESKARADPGGQRKAPTATRRAARTVHGGAEDPPGSMSIAVRVLPPTPAVSPGAHEQGEHSSTGPVDDISGGVDTTGADVDTDEVDVDTDDADVDTDDGGDDTSMGESGGRVQGTPLFAGAHDRSRGAHLTGPDSLRRGKLPFTGRNQAILILSGFVAVLTGAILLWLSAAR
jgi:hypothetical protein